MIARLSLLCLLAVSASPTQEGTKVEAPEAPVGPSATVERFGLVTRIELALPGELLAHARVDPGAGPEEIWLLMRPPVPPPEAAPCALPGPALQLWRAGLDGTVPRRVRADLPPDASGLHAVAGRGSEGASLFLVRPGELIAIDRSETEPTTPRVAMADPDLPGWFAPDSLDPWLVVPGLAESRFYRAAGGAWDLAAGVALRPEVRSGLQVMGSTLYALGTTPDGRALWATAPEAVGRQRLRVSRLEPGHAEKSERAVECWARLPEPERLLEWRFAMLAGRPLLVVLTTSAEKLGLFAEKRLRVLPLEPDRSRSGHPPLMATSTGANLWQSATVTVRDVDGDGHDDLLVGYWKGLGDTRVVLESYLGGRPGWVSRFASNDGVRRRGRGSFVHRLRPRSRRGRQGRPRAADGRTADAVSGLPARADRGKRLVESEPVWDVPLGECARATGGSAEISVSIGGSGTSVAAVPGGTGRPRVVGRTIEIAAPCGLTVVTPVD